MNDGNGTVIKDGDTCNQTEVYTCTETNMQASCQFYRYGQTTEGLYMQIYNLFGFFWGLFFIEALDQMVLAGAFASWYWVLNKKDVPKMPLMSSFYRTFRYHIGTLAFGSLIIAIIRMIRVLIEYIEEKLKEYQQDNPLVKVPTYILISLRAGSLPIQHSNGLAQDEYHIVKGTLVTCS